MTIVACIVPPQRPLQAGVSIRAVFGKTNTFRTQDMLNILSSTALDV